MRYLLILYFGLYGIHCGDPTEPDPVEPPDTELCDEACVNLRLLGCEEGQPLPDGSDGEITCEEWCIYIQNQGHWLNPRCIRTITSCEQIYNCGEE